MSELDLSPIEEAVQVKLAEWVETKPVFELIGVFDDDHIACAEFSINGEEQSYNAFWIGAENVGAFKYASHCTKAYEDVISIIRDKLLSGPFEVDDDEYRIAIAVGFSYDVLLQIGMLDL